VGSEPFVTIADSRPSDFAVDVTRTGSLPLIQPKGLLDGPAGKPLEATLLEFASAPEVLLDLSEVRQLDAAVVAMLLRLREQGVRVRCIEPSPAAESVLQATGAAMVLALSPV